MDNPNTQDVATKLCPLIAFHVGENDIVAAFDAQGAIKVLCEFGGYPADQFQSDDVDVVNDTLLDNRQVYDQDEGGYVTLEKSLREELSALTKPAYLIGWE